MPLLRRVSMARAQFTCHTSRQEHTWHATCNKVLAHWDTLRLPSASFVAVVLPHIACPNAEFARELPSTCSCWRWGVDGTCHDGSPQIPLGVVISHSRHHADIACVVFVHWCEHDLTANFGKRRGSHLCMQHLACWYFVARHCQGS